MALSTKILVICSLILTLGCSSVQAFNPKSMPKYDTKAIENHNGDLFIAEQYYFNLSLMYVKLMEAGVQPTKEEDANLTVHVNKYLYWYSVGIIQLFNGEYTLSAESTKKAIAALNEYKAGLIKMVYRHQGI